MMTWWSDVNTAKRMIGVMPQPDQTFRPTTGLQLLISGMLRGMNRDETTRRAQDLLNASTWLGPPTRWSPIIRPA